MDCLLLWPLLLPWQFNDTRTQSLLGLPVNAMNKTSVWTLRTRSSTKVTPPPGQPHTQPFMGDGILAQDCRWLRSANVWQLLKKKGVQKFPQSFTKESFLMKTFFTQSPRNCGKTDSRKSVWREEEKRVKVGVGCIWRQSHIEASFSSWLQVWTKRSRSLASWVEEISLTSV